jgi:hypothetical protein
LTEVCVTSRGGRSLVLRDGQRSARLELREGEQRVLRPEDFTGGTD